MKIGLLNPQYNQSFKATVEFDDKSFSKYEESKKSAKFQKRHAEEDIETIEKCRKFLGDEGAKIAKEKFPEQGVFKVSVKEGHYNDYYGHPHRKALVINIDYFKNAESKKAFETIKWSPVDISFAKFLKTIGVPTKISPNKLPFTINPKADKAKVMSFHKLLKSMSKPVENFDGFQTAFDLKTENLRSKLKLKG